MKKKYCLIGLALATLFSCTDDTIFAPENETPEGQITVQAQIAQPDGDGTRTTIADTEDAAVKDIVWQAGDAISISIGGSSTSSDNQKFTLTEGAGTKTASFTGVQPQGLSDYYAMYPYDSSNNLTKPNATWLMDFTWNGQEQTATLGSYDPTKATMVGKTEFLENGLQFKNVFAYAKVTTNYSVKSITLTVKEGDYLASKTLDVYLDSEGNPVVNSIGNGSQTITLTGANGANIKPGSYLIPVLPGTLNGSLELKFTSAVDETKTYAKSTQNTVTFTRGRILDFGTIDLKDLVQLQKTSDGAYKISSFAELEFLSDAVNNNIGDYATASYHQMADIDAQGQSLNPIGTANNPFKGTYVGGMWSIQNIQYNKSYVCNKNLSLKQYSSALFGVISNASISDLIIENPSFNLDAGQESSQDLVLSPLVGQALGKSDGENSIVNCTVKGTDLNLTYEKEVLELFYGGMVGYNTSNLKLDKCINELNVTVQVASDSNIGGLVGRVSNGVESPEDYKFTSFDKISNCRNKGNITAQFTKNDNYMLFAMGGIVGRIINEGAGLAGLTCNLWNVVNEGAISTATTLSSAPGFGYLRMGGLVGDLETKGTSDNEQIIMNCLNRGAVTNTIASTESRVGGIVGYVYFSNPAFNFNVNAAKVSDVYSHIGAISGGTNGKYNYCSNYYTTSDQKYEAVYGSSSNITGYTNYDNAADVVSTHNNYIADYNQQTSGMLATWKTVTVNNELTVDLNF